MLQHSWQCIATKADIQCIKILALLNNITCIKMAKKTPVNIIEGDLEDLTINILLEFNWDNIHTSDPNCCHSHFFLLFK